MIRRLFRIGLLVGLLVGLAIALTKLLGNHTAEAPNRPARSPEPWPRLSRDPAVAPPQADEQVTKAIENAIAKGEQAAVAAAAKATKKATKKAASVAKVWVEPAGGVCPTTHPVKAKISSKIFHLPGMANYERTKPDRCYADAAAAEADGLRAAKH